MSRNCAYKEAKEKGKEVKMRDLVGFFVCLFLAREKRTLKWGFRKLGFYPSSAERFPQIIFPFLKLTAKKYKLVFKFILIIPRLRFGWQSLHATIKQNYKT